MKHLTLDNIIKEEYDKDEDFAKHYDKEMLINAISKMVVSLRHKVHLTQETLANRANTTQPVIARIESGSDSRVPSLDLLARIAAASDAQLDIGFHMNDKRR